VPTEGVLVAKASIAHERGDARSALSQLDALPSEAVASYQPYRVLRAHCLLAAGDRIDAQAAAEAALRLTDDPAIKDYLAAAFAGFGQPE